MKLILECPWAKYDSRMRIECTKAGGQCAHQRFKPCKGWCVLTEQAAKCTAREDKTNA